MTSFVPTAMMRQVGVERFRGRDLGLQRIGTPGATDGKGPDGDPVTTIGEPGRDQSEPDLGWLGYPGSGAGRVAQYDHR